MAPLPLPPLRMNVYPSPNAGGADIHFDCSGNNAIAFKSSQTATTAESGADLDFEFVQDPTQAPTVTVNVNAARVNAFYIVNSIHDISYQYGFTEAAFKYVIALAPRAMGELTRCLASRTTTLETEARAMIV